MNWLLPIVVIVCPLVACERPDAADVEERLRGDPARPGKVGTLRGLEVRHHAAAVAAAVVSRPEPGCATVPETGPVIYTHRLNVERHRAGREIAGFEERRIFTRDADGNLSVVSRLDAVTETGQRTGHELAWRLVGERVYRGENGYFWARPADDPVRRRIRVAGLATLQTLLDLARGLSPGESDGVWELGTAEVGDRLRCSRLEEPAGFRDRFVALATPLEARLEVADGRRNYRASFELGDGSRLKVVFEDEVDELERPVTAPADEAVVDARPDRSLARASKLLDDLVERGHVIPDGGASDEAE